ncbi:hypothetical protein D3C76_1122250 [compost metagenome]
MGKDKKGKADRRINWPLRSFHDAGPVFIHGGRNFTGTLEEMVESTGIHHADRADWSSPTPTLVRIRVAARYRFETDDRPKNALRRHIDNVFYPGAAGLPRTGLHQFFQTG